MLQKWECGNAPSDWLTTGTIYIVKMRRGTFFFTLQQGKAILIISGCDINKVDYRGLSALAVASEHGNTEAAEILISKGALINQIRELADNPLHVAVMKGHLPMVSKLLKTECEGQ